MGIDKCVKHLKAHGKPYPRTCPECGLGGSCKYVAELEMPDGDADLAAARLIQQRASNELVREIRTGSTTASNSKWYALYGAIADCWPELDAKK